MKTRFDELRFDHLTIDGQLEEYGRFQQHLVLLEDELRVSTYLQAIQSKAQGALVVDVGAGTGVLGLLALRFGAEHAFLVEPSKKMGAYIRHLAKLNGFSDRITVLPSTLESLNLDVLPSSIDLLVSETLSSCLFGFGSWDALPQMVKHVSNPAGIIPICGTLYGALTDRDLSTRGPTVGGLAVLNTSGLRCDLFERTFRSGGNIYDKRVYLEAVASNELQPLPIASFDFSSEEPYWFGGAALRIPESGSAKGLVLAWKVCLSKLNSLTLNSADPSLSSWYPYYVQFREPVVGNSVNVRMTLSRRDAPYPYAIQFLSGDEPLTDLLFW